MAGGDESRQPAAEGHGELVVEHDHADLAYDHGVYRATMRRRLANHGQQPVTRYLIRISVDRYPGDPERSNQLYRDDPLTWDELNLRAWYGPERAEELRWSVQHDRDAFKEVWLQLEGSAGRFPLYPGEAAGSSTATPSRCGSGATGSAAPCACPPVTCQSRWTFPAISCPPSGGCTHR